MHGGVFRSFAEAVKYGYWTYFRAHPRTEGHASDARAPGGKFDANYFAQNSVDQVVAQCGI